MREPSRETANGSIPIVRGGGRTVNRALGCTDVQVGASRLDAYRPDLVLLEIENFFAIWNETRSSGCFNRRRPA